MAFIVPKRSQLEALLAELNSSLTSAINAVSSTLSALSDVVATKAPTNNPTFTGTVSGVTKAHVGLGNASNTSDADKPVSTAQQAALDGKAAAPTRTSTASASTLTPVGDVERSELYLTALAAAATIAAPSGTPANGNRLLLRIKDNGTARALTWGAAYRAIGVTLPATTVVGKTVYVGAYYNAADSKWDVLAVGQEA